MALDAIRNYSSVSIPKVAFGVKGSPGELYKVGDLIGTPGVEIQADGDTADMIIRGNIRVKKVGAGLSAAANQGVKLYAVFNSSGKATNLTTNASTTNAVFVGYLHTAFAVADTEVLIVLWQS